MYNALQQGIQFVAKVKTLSKIHDLLGKVQNSPEFTNIVSNNPTKNSLEGAEKQSKVTRQE